MRGKATRVFVEFTKTNGKRAGSWESAPNNWNKMSQRDRDGWVTTAARKLHPGAKEATVTKVEQA